MTRRAKLLWVLAALILIAADVTENKTVMTILVFCCLFAVGAAAHYGLEPTKSEEDEA